MEFKRKLGAAWAAIGVTLILGSALMRVAPKVVDALRIGLSPGQWAVLVMWSVVMLVSEGYRGFQQQFSPRFAARMWHLTQKGNGRDLWLAPLFCIGYYGSTRRRMITSWTLTLGVTAIILIVIQLAQPWRGIVDAGVVLGLFYGLIATYVCIVQTWRQRTYLADPEVRE